MSYCRWSDDLGRCDVYVYEDVMGGWTIHVAGRRLANEIPAEIEQMPESNAYEWIARQDACSSWKDGLSTEEWIDLETVSEHAGKTYNLPTALECAEKLEEIRASGLNVPQHAIDELKAEPPQSEGE